MEGFLEFLPGDILGVFRGIATVIPRISCCSNELEGCQKNSVPSSGMDDIKFPIDLSKPIVCLEGVFGAVEGGRSKLHELRESCFCSTGVLAASLSVLDKGLQWPSLLCHDGNQIIH